MIRRWVLNISLSGRSHLQAWQQRSYQKSRSTGLSWAELRRNIRAFSFSSSSTHSLLALFLPLHPRQLADKTNKKTKKNHGKSPSWPRGTQSDVNTEGVSS